MRAAIGLTGDTDIENERFDRKPKNGASLQELSEPSSLYPGEDEIARRVLGKNANKWGSLAPLWEREGLPRIDPLTGGRYWPACRAWFDQRNGLRQGRVPASSDGPEQW